jgi:peptide methionine sulfoxide reductase MsrA
MRLWNVAPAVPARVRRSESEDYHQQYLDKVPNGYCPNHATGVKLPDGFAVIPLQYVD